MIRKSIAAAGALVLGLTGQTALAGGYAAVGVGSADYDGDEQDISSSLVASIAITDHLGAEVGFYDFGTIEYIDKAPGDFRAESFTLGVNGRFPVSDTVDVFGRLGMGRWSSRFETGGPGNTRVDRENGVSPYGAIGAAWHFHDDFSAAVEYQLHQVDVGGDQDEEIAIGNAQLSIRARF